MPERTVSLASMFYIDVDGRPRWGDLGQTVNVHPDFVGRFDALNVLAPPAESAEPAPRSRRGRPRKDVT